MNLKYLLNTYYNKEHWHRTRLERWQAEEYFKKALDNKNIAILKEDNNIVGYIEVWFLDKDQLARVLRNENIDVLQENLTDGEFVYVASIFVEEPYRHNGAVNRLNKLMQTTHEGRDYVGIIFQDGFNRKKFSFYNKGEI